LFVEPVGIFNFEYEGLNRGFYREEMQESLYGVFESAFGIELCPKGMIVMQAQQTSQDGFQSLQFAGKGGIGAVKLSEQCLECGFKESTVLGGVAVLGLIKVVA